MRYHFEFGSLQCRHTLSSTGHVKATCKYACMKSYRPLPWSKSAQFLKMCEVLNGAPRRFFNDSACVSNLFKAGLIKREGKKFYPTRKGRYYLSKNVVELDVTEFLLKDSRLRYVKDELTRVAITLMIGDKSYDVVDELLRKEI